MMPADLKTTNFINTFKLTYKWCVDGNTQAPP